MADLLAPWFAVDDGDALERELRRELALGHILHGRPVRAIARRHDLDDVLFELSDTGECAVVHLTWTSRAERPPFPMARAFVSLAVWASTEMVEDHREAEGEA